MIEVYLCSGCQDRVPRFEGHFQAFWDPRRQTGRQAGRRVNLDSIVHTGGDSIVVSLSGRCPTRPVS